MPRDGWPSIDPGDLRHQIVIQQLCQPKPPQFDAGGAVTTWADFTSAWAKVEPAKGSDVVRDGQTTAKLPIEVTIRFQPGIIPSMRVKVQDFAQKTETFDYYIIESIEDVQKRGVLLKLTCLGLDDNS